MIVYSIFNSKGHFTKSLCGTFFLLPNSHFETLAETSSFLELNTRLLDIGTVSRDFSGKFLRLDFQDFLGKKTIPKTDLVLQTKLLRIELNNRE